MSNRNNHFYRVFQSILVAIVFFICLWGAFHIQMKFCPDERFRLRLSDWICENKCLPIGNEQQIKVGSYGFSYALRPYLSAIIGAFFKTVFSNFTDSENYSLLASRMCSVLSASILSFFSFKIGNTLFENKLSSTLFGVIISFLPQVIFLGMYQNNDILSLASVVLMIFFFLKCHKNGWRIIDCVGLAVSVSVGLLSYYSIYGWILMGGVYFIFDFIANKDYSLKEKKVRVCIIVAVILVASGWHFFRTAWYNNGDFLGMATEEANREMLIQQGEEVYQYNKPCDNPNSWPFPLFVFQSDFHWLRLVQQSTIGLFGKMNIYLSNGKYYFYYSIFGIGVVLYSLSCFRNRDSFRFHMWIYMFSSVLITFFLSAYASYYRDYQPQGRYTISVIVFLAYMISYAFDKLSVKNHRDLISVNRSGFKGNKSGKNLMWNTLAVILIVLWIVQFSVIYSQSIITMYES